MRKKLHFYLFFDLCILALIFLFSGCAGGSGFFEDAAEETGTYELTVAWPEAAKPEADVKLIPTGAHFINVSIEGEGLDSPFNTGITYPQTMLQVNNLPLGQKVATIQALNSSSNLLAQRKESFIINQAETTDSENIPLGIALTGTTTNPVFQPSSIQVDYGEGLYFQNWLDTGFTVRASTNGVNNDILIPGFDSNGNYFCGIFPMKGRESASWSLPAKSGVTGSSSIVLDQFVSGTPVRIADLLPKSSNGENGVLCRRRNSAISQKDMDRLGNYSYRDDYSSFCYMKSDGNNLIIRSSYSTHSAFLIIPLNASGFGKIQLTGKAKDYDPTSVNARVRFRVINSGESNAEAGTAFFDTGNMTGNTYYDVSSSANYSAGQKFVIQVTANNSQNAPGPLRFEDFYIQGTN